MINYFYRLKKAVFCYKQKFRACFVGKANS
jgi:hypothetical protein